MRTVVHLLRHGEVHNPEGVLYGRLPGFSLSERGRQQALRVAQHLTATDIACVVSSPLERAVQTADPVAASHRLDVATDENLIEAANEFEGEQVSLGRAAFRDPRRWPKLANPFQPSWAEPYLRVAHRMLAAVHAARGAAGGHEAVCVSHQLPIWALRRFVEGKRLWHDPRHRECALASLTSLEFADERLVSVSYSQPAGPADSRAAGA